MAGAAWSSDQQGGRGPFRVQGKQLDCSEPRGCQSAIKSASREQTPSASRRNACLTADRSRKRDCEASDSDCNKENESFNNGGPSAPAGASKSRCTGSGRGRKSAVVRRRGGGFNASESSSEPTEDACHRKGSAAGTASKEDTSKVDRVHRELKGLIQTAPLKSRRTSAYSSGWSLSQKLDLLLQMGVLSTTEVNYSEEVHTLSICGQFAEENHLAMLQDSERVSHYRKAMHWTGEPSSAGRKLVEGRRVLEIGTGPICLLSINAVNAGAKHVVALEASRPSHCRAKKFVEAIGVSHKIDVVHGYSKRVAAEVFKNPEVVIHEIIGDFASQEGVADAILDVQERTGTLPLSIPFGAETLICPASLPEPEHFLYPAHSYEGRSILSPRRILLQSVRLNTTHLMLSEFQAFETLKFQEPMKDQMEQKKTLSFVITRSGCMAGLLAVIKIEIYPGKFFGTFRNGETDSWYTSLILLPEEVEVEPGDVVMVESCADMRNYCTVSNPKPSQKAGSKADCRSVLVSKPTYTFTVDIRRPSFSFRRPFKSFAPIVVSFEEQAPVLCGATRKYSERR